MSLSNVPYVYCWCVYLWYSLCLFKSSKCIGEIRPFFSYDLIKSKWDFYLWIIRNIKSDIKTQFFIWLIFKIRTYCTPNYKRGLMKKLQSHCRKYSEYRDVLMMYWCGYWGSTGGRWMMRLDDLGSLLHPWWFYDSIWLKFPYIPVDTEATFHLWSHIFCQSGAVYRCFVNILGLMA